MSNNIKTKPKEKKKNQKRIYKPLLSNDQLLKETQKK